MLIDYAAPRAVRQTIAALGRTEDLCFSPDSRRLAIACYGASGIAICDVDLAVGVSGPSVSLPGAVMLCSPALKEPHGLAFLDDGLLVVTNRGGDVALFDVPPASPDAPSRDVTPRLVMPAGGSHLLQSPGSVAVSARDGHRCELVICNNASHTITRHVVDIAAGPLVNANELLLQKWLGIPDGVSVSRDRDWIAVSNHDTHAVLIYARTALGPDADPVGILRGLYYPHGLRFTPDGDYLFVADAGAPYIQIYARDAEGWAGVRHPVASIRVMDEEMFHRDRVNLEEGGPKGIDLDGSGRVLAMTSERLPLVFLDVSVLLSSADVNPASRRERIARDVGYELTVMERSRDTLEYATSTLDYMTHSRSWRYTAPFRRLQSLVGGVRRRRSRRT